MTNYCLKCHELGLVKEFIRHRQQVVKVGKELFSVAYVKEGDPQGSVIGPLLFLVYVNDLVYEVNSQIRLFADDRVIYRNIKINLVKNFYNKIYIKYLLIN